VKLLRWMFPNGIGTRAVLALLVLVAALAPLAYLAARGSELAINALVGLATMVVTWYFARRDESAKEHRPEAAPGGSDAVQNREGPQGSRDGGGGGDGV
jgi:hypothetical protein